MTAVTDITAAAAARPLATRNKRLNLDTAIDVAMRPADHKPDPAAKAWPGDRQGFTLISQADTADNWAKHQKQWVKHETTFTAPSHAVSAAQQLSQTGSATPCCTYGQHCDLRYSLS